MDELKSEFVKAIMTALKIEHNPFIVATIDNFISAVPPLQYGEFMNNLFGTQHAYLNGIDRVAKVAEQFKPVVIDDDETKAQELLELVYSMNKTVYDNALSSGRTFADEMDGTKFVNINKDDMAILNQIKPYTDHKQLATNISSYANGLEQLKAFKSAIKYSQRYSGAIECSRVKGLLK